MHPLGTTPPGPLHLMQWGPGPPHYRYPFRVSLIEKEEQRKNSLKDRKYCDNKKMERNYKIFKAEPHIYGCNRKFYEKRKTSPNYPTTLLGIELNLGGESFQIDTLQSKELAPEAGTPPQ